MKVVDVVGGGLEVEDNGGVCVGEAIVEIVVVGIVVKRIGASVVFGATCVSYGRVTGSGCR